MRIIGNNIAVLDNPKDMLSVWVEESGRLCHDGGVEKYYIPYINVGDVVIDVGAAIGDHTIAYIQKTGDSSLVHAFECNPDMVECLRHNCPKAHIYPFALSDSIGPACLKKLAENNDGAGYVSTSNIDYGIPIVEITLDAFRFSKVDFIKMDIEGLEYRAIVGAERTLERCRPRMIIEICDSHLKRAGSSMFELEALIDSFGYSFEHIMGSRVEGRYEALCLPK